MKSSRIDLASLIAAERGKVTHVRKIERPEYGHTYVTVDCGLDTPPEVALAAAGLSDDDTVEDVDFAHRRTFGGVQVCGWVYTVKAWATGARSSLATGCVESLA